MRYITAVLFTTIATVVVIFYAIPLYQGSSMIPGLEDGIVQLKQKTADVKELTEKTSAARDSIRALQQQYASLPTESLTSASVMVPASIDPVQLSYDIYRLGVDHGVSLANPNITKGPKDDKAPFQKYNVSISFETSYDNALALIHDVEYSLQIRDINSLSITPSEGGARTKVSLSFTTYAQK